MNSKCSLIIPASLCILVILIVLEFDPVNGQEEEGQETTTEAETQDYGQDDESGEKKGKNNTIVLTFFKVVHIDFIHLISHSVCGESFYY